MFGLGFTEILVLLIIAFLVFGPQQLPIIAKNFVRILNEFKGIFTDIKKDLYDTETQQHLQQITEDVKKDFDSLKTLSFKEKEQDLESLEKEQTTKISDSSLDITKAQKQKIKD